MAATLILLLQIYAATGALVALVFLTFGIGRIESHARRAYLFRPLLVPGILLIWPMVLWRWWQLETGRTQPAKRHLPPHRVQSAIAVALALLIPMIVLSALILRQNAGVNYPAVKLEDAE